MKLIDKRYYGIYLVSAIIVASLVFMLSSTVVVMKNIGGGKTSADMAIERAKKACNQANGELVRLKKDDPLYTKCIAGEDKAYTNN